MTSFLAAQKAVSTEPYSGNYGLYWQAERTGPLHLYN